VGVEDKGNIFKNPVQEALPGFEDMKPDDPSVTQEKQDTPIENYIPKTTVQIQEDISKMPEDEQKMYFSLLATRLYGDVGTRRNFQLIDPNNETFSERERVLKAFYKEFEKRNKIKNEDRRSRGEKTKKLISFPYFLKRSSLSLNTNIFYRGQYYSVSYPFSYNAEIGTETFRFTHYGLFSGNRSWQAVEQKKCLTGETTFEVEEII
jgi:hypothetical protein